MNYCDRCDHAGANEYVCANCGAEFIVCDDCYRAFNMNLKRKGEQT